jgi:hypothetical protein
VSPDDDRPEDEKVDRGNFDPPEEPMPGNEIDGQSDSSEDQEEPRHFDEVPEAKNLRPEDIPDPTRGDTVEKDALQANAVYFDTSDLAMAGRLAGTYEFLPGRMVRFHTPDDGEVIWIGKAMDREFGKLTPQVGVSSSYDNGVQLITLSIVVDYIDSEPVYEALSDFEDPQNSLLSWADRERALERKSNVVRNAWQYHNSWVHDRMYQCYRHLLERQREALLILPFFSAAGVKSLDSDHLSGREFTEIVGLLLQARQSSISSISMIGKNIGPPTSEALVS